MKRLAAENHFVSDEERPTSDNRAIGGWTEKIPSTARIYVRMVL
jgi:hypothetical protein